VNFVGLRDAGDPVQLAARYNSEGADELVVLDIAASRDQRLHSWRPFGALQQNWRSINRGGAFAARKMLEP